MPAAVHPPHLPEPLLVEACARAAGDSVLPALNDAVFPGYWSVCADGVDFGGDNSYPSLDGHEIGDALLWLGRADAVRANWEHVLAFQRPDGLLPLAILPGLAGQRIGVEPAMAAVDANGGLYHHWVPGDPLLALGPITCLQNADVIYRHTLDRAWLAAQLPAVDRAAGFLESLTSAAGAVGGAGFYVERPTRMDCDGVTQAHAVDALERLASLHRILDDTAGARRWQVLADRIAAHFRRAFWAGDHCVEYLHPERGPVSHHGLTDVDWSALATGVADAEQTAALWPRLRHEEGFRYGGMPTGISTRPDSYEDWEFTHPDRHDLAAMGRVWHVEARARARMGDGEGLAAGLRRVAQVGRDAGWFWRERYHPSAGGAPVGAGARKYLQYPANLIRIVHELLLGIGLGGDGSLRLAPVVPAPWWETGFGHELDWAGSRLAWRWDRDGLRGRWNSSRPLRLELRSPATTGAATARLDGRTVPVRAADGAWRLDLPPGDGELRVGPA